MSCTWLRLFIKESELEPYKTTSYVCFELDALGLRLFALYSFWYVLCACRFVICSLGPASWSRDPDWGSSVKYPGSRISEQLGNYTLLPGCCNEAKPIRPSVRRSSVCPSVRLSVRPSVRPSVGPSISPSFHPSVCPHTQNTSPDTQNPSPDTRNTSPDIQNTSPNIQNQAQASKIQVQTSKTITPDKKNTEKSIPFYM